MTPFEELYRLWITNSINRKIADEVFVARDGELIVGMVTLKKDGGVGRIGLITVDPCHRGKQIGGRLLAKADGWYGDHGVSRAEVVAQGANISACRFYEGNGYRHDSLVYVYHIWQGNKVAPVIDDAVAGKFFHS